VDTGRTVRHTGALAVNGRTPHTAHRLLPTPFARTAARRFLHPLDGDERRLAVRSARTRHRRRLARGADRVRAAIADLAAHRDVLADVLLQFVVAGGEPHPRAALDERRTVRRRHGGLGLGCGLADAAQLIAVAWRGDDASVQRDAIVHAPLAPGLHAALVIRRVVGAGHGERGRKDG